MSGPIRTQLGTAKRYLSRQISSAKQLFGDYNLDFNNPQLTPLDNSTLKDLHLDVESARKNLLAAYNTVNNLHNAWNALMTTNPAEIQVHDNYIEQYGDYRTAVGDAVSTMDKLDHTINLMDAEYTTRQMNPPRIPSPDSDRDSPNSHDDAFVQETHRAPINVGQRQAFQPRSDQFIPSGNITGNNTAQLMTMSLQPSGTMATSLAAENRQPFGHINFVDASILSKLELPTFEGNLLHYPEFWSRFSTLVGNKTELDNATKFSLLKSCLKGRALMSIQGLAITPANYSIAIDILKTHYDDETTTRHIIFTKLFSLPSCDPDGKNLISLYNQMFSLIRQYSSYAGDSREYALGVALINKLPRNVRSRIYDKTSHKNITPTELLNLLTDIARKESTLQAMEPQHSDKSFSATVHNSRKPPTQPHKKSSPQQHHSSQLGNRNAGCRLCDSKEHNVFHCTMYSTGQQRSKAAKEKGVCLNCLSHKHTLKDCPSTTNCKNCQRRHHTALCFNPPPIGSSPGHQTIHPQTNNSGSHQARTQQTRPPATQRPQNQHYQGQQQRQHQVHYTNEDADCNPSYNEGDYYSGPTSVQVLATVEQSYPDSGTNNVCQSNESQTTHQVILMCTEVTLFNPDYPERSVRTTAFMDSGSSKSYITKEVVLSLNLPFDDQEELHMHTFGSLVPKTITASLHKVGLLTVDGGQKHLEVKSIPTLTSSLTVLQLDQSTNAVKVKSSTPGILVGNDYFWDLVLSTDFHSTLLPNGYRMIQTKIGKIITGKSFNHEHFYSTDITSSKDLQNPGHHKKLEQLVERFWNYESLGIVDNPTESDDSKCLQDFNDNIFMDKKEGRYIVKLPFKVDPKELPSNYNLAYSRLASNVKNLSRNEEYMKKYHEIIMDQLHRGIIEEVQYPDMSPFCHYLAHHGVITETKKTTKIRCVYDGSAKTKGHISLNEALYRGPVLLPDITGILIRIRTAPILISSDIEKAFLMVGLHQDSRPFTRFLWLRDPSKGMLPENIVTYGFCRVPFGLIVSPFLLAGTIHFHLASTGTDLSEGILKNCYVDNIFNSVNTVEEGKQVYVESKKLFQQAGMNLREYVSSNKELNKYFATKEGCSIDVNSKILGISWNTQTDTLSITLPSTPTDVSIWTKRKVLKQVASIYDPLGWIAPVTLVGKVFLQSLWKEDMNWDQPLTDELHQAWTAITETWLNPTLQMPRRFSCNLPKESTFAIHIFTDASKDAYCAVAYVIEVHNQQKITVSLLMSKTRLAPQKLPSITIPRLELSGITIGSSLLKHVEEQLDLPIKETFIWSDSRVALMWIKTEKDLPVFVRNRVRTIKQNSPRTELRHVPGDLNPADVGSRGTSIEDLMNYTAWWNGPEFLKKSKEHWPEDKSDMPATEKMNATSSSTAMFVSEPEVPLSVGLIDSRRFSSWNRMLNTMTTLLMFVAKTSKQFFNFGKPQLRESAEHVLFLQAQSENPPSDNVKQQLKLFTCPTTRLLKCQGRIDNSELPYSTTSPIFLPRENRITELFILNTHLRALHCGTEQTIVELRKSVWIPKARTTVKKVLHNSCYHCKRMKARPYMLPEFPQHPPQRVRRPHYPFENSGMDYMGPMFYRTQDQSVEKYWILLLTCLNSRAIFVDIVTDINQELQSALAPQEHHDDIIDYCAQHKISFKFIPSHSPWQGGLYERMVGIFKTAYKHAVNKRILPLDTLRTLCKEAEAICNSRPLTHVTDDLQHFPIRPADFLHPTAPLSPPRFIEKEEDDWKPCYSTRDEVLKDWKDTSLLSDNFWERWLKEYLPGLREQYQISHPHPRLINSNNPQNGDIVLIHDYALDKGQWKLGQICGSMDNYLRSAQIRLPSRNIITRPINLISKMEIPQVEQTIMPVAPPVPIRHPMTTRSRVRTTSLAATMMMITLLLQPAAAISSTRCPDEITTPKTIIYATNCAIKGVAIATYTLLSKVELCWFPIECPMGAIRVSLPMKPNEGFCGSECKCPTWSTSCSHSKSLRRTSSTINHMPINITTYRPTEVCSFTKSDECSKSKKIGIFNQIELFDGKTVIVSATRNNKGICGLPRPQLHVTIKEFVDSQDFICFDRSGKQVETQEPYSGTSFFCEKNTCQDVYTTFCTFDNPVALFNADSDQTTPFLIRAWGTTPKQYFSSLTSTNTNHQISNEPTCSRGGITIFTDITLDIVEACVRSYCVFLTNYTTSTPIFFPSELVVFTYQVKMEIWKDGVSIYRKTILCPAQPLCEAIECTICWEKIYNPQCWTTMEIVKTVLSLLLFCIGYYIAVPILRTTAYIGYLLFLPCMFILRRIRSRCRPTRKLDPLPKYSRKKKTHRNHRVAPLLTIVAVCLLIRSTLECSEVTSVTASEDICTTDSSNNTECTFNQATTLTLQPLGQETCLALRNFKQEPVGTVSFKFSNVLYTCNKRIDFYTRDHHFVSESSHRCYKAGSCQEGRCDNTKSNDNLEELSSTAKRSPGYTFCASSCGCVTCGGCFFCSPSCLFYRYYAAPTTTEIYTVYSCPTWELTVNVDIAIMEKNKRQTKSLTLQPGKAVRWNSMKLSLLSATTPQMPLLSTSFLTDGRSTSTISSVSTGQLIPSTVGQLQCRNWDDSKNFNCKFSSNVCSCSNGPYKVSCSCSSGNIASYLKTNKLPLLTKNVLISEENKQVTAKAQIGSAVQVLLVVEGLKITTQTDLVTCQITTSALTGCYSCTLGSEVNIACTAEKDTTADIKCGTQTQLALCTPRGHLTTLHFHFDQPTVNEECFISCSGGATSFQLTGNLEYVNDNPLQWEENIDNQVKTAKSFNIMEPISEWITETFSIINTLKSILKHSLLILAIIFILLLWFKYGTFWMPVFLRAEKKRI